MTEHRSASEMVDQGWGVFYRRADGTVDVATCAAVFRLFYVVGVPGHDEEAA